jgi:hypothetical protein
VPRTEKSPHFFDREPDGSVRLRLRFSEEEANLIEEAAGRTPLIPWIHKAIGVQASHEARKVRRSRPKVRPE